MLTKFQAWIQVTMVSTFLARQEQYKRVIFRYCSDCPAQSDCHNHGSGDEPQNCFDSFKKWADSPYENGLPCDNNSTPITNLQVWLKNARPSDFQEKVDTTRTVFHNCDECPARRDCCEENEDEEIGCFSAFLQWANLPHDGTAFWEETEEEKKLYAFEKKLKNAFNASRRKA